MATIKHGVEFDDDEGPPEEEPRCSVCWKPMHHHRLTSVRLACKSEHGWGVPMTADELTAFASLKGME